MKLPLHIAKKIQQLLLPGETIAGSAMQHKIVEKMLEDGAIQKQHVGKTKSLIFISNRDNLATYLHNHFGISDLQLYINKQTKELSRAEAVILSGNSKLQKVRTFKGFLINSYEPVSATLNGDVFTINPIDGTYIFIYDYENFIPDKAVTIVGVENAENFRQLTKQQYLFADKQLLFVSRYPQGKDLVKWLQALPNVYLHFGDLDFEGIKIYNTEFKKHLGDRAQFFIPENTEALLQQYGNSDLYNQQYMNRPLVNNSTEAGIKYLIELILKYKKVLEQEAFILKM